MTNDERDAFLAAIIERPDDDAPRLVFADWLEEQGDAVCAEFIRLQLDLVNATDNAEGERLADRLRKVLALRHPSLSHFGHPIQKLPDNPVSVPFYSTVGDDRRLVVRWVKRGFVEAIVCDWHSWLNFGDDELSTSPIRDVRLTHRPEIDCVVGSDIDKIAWFLKGRNRAIQVYSFEDLTLVDERIRRLLKANWPRVVDWSFPPSAFVSP